MTELNDEIVFYNETSLNRKYQIKTNMNLDHLDLLKIGEGYIHSHKGSIYKNLNNYWASKKTLNEIIEAYKSERTFF